ncbi:amidohydrolase family protein [Amycolatopsis mediterranei]|uniref:amidohydrolase family protein n=1 Tax=Amycolatopsis mediterranei TaxID=33910 RepID=UPI00343AEAD8
MRKIIALEEHLATPRIAEAWKGAPDAERDGYTRFTERGTLGERLLDLGARRLADMDDQGVDVQVLSVTTPGVQNLAPDVAVPLAREANNAIAAAIRSHPDRFEGFATLPTPDPAAAAEELDRTVTQLGFAGAMIVGRTGAKNIDHPGFEPIWATAARLRAPVYLHPQLPVPAVRDAYYSGIDPAIDYLLGGPGIGWHYETGVQLLRLILSGTFDRHPDLQLVTGHWGEVVLFYTERLAKMQEWGQLPLERQLIDYLRSNVSYTGSGDLSDRYLRWAIDVVGVERIMYATDYPFVDTGAGQARRFLENADLSNAERDAIAHGNWERLTARTRS